MRTLLACLCVLPLLFAALGASQPPAAALTDEPAALADATLHAVRFVDANEDLDLFALRAMARQPLHVLARISDDPAGAWRRQDRRVVHALATLELKEEGLRPPPLAERPV